MIIKIQSLVRSLFFVLCCLLALPTINAQVEPIVSVQKVHGGLFVQTPYGNFILDGRRDRVIIEIINSEAFQRLRKIFQYGPSHYVNPNVVYGRYDANLLNHVGYTRFEHSICCAMLARLCGRPITEQLAALLHDISHTALSHVGDVVFGSNQPATEAYQDTILEQFLEEHDIADILRRNRIAIPDVLKKPAFLDRLDYTLTGCWLAGLLDQEDIDQIVTDLAYNKRLHLWYFKNTQIALRIANCALDFAQINHSAPWNTIVFSLTARALKRAFDLGLFSEEDFKYNLCDDDIWNLLTTSKDRVIRRYMNKITNHQSFLGQEGESSDSDAPSIIVAPKFRGFDPHVQIAPGKHYKLTEINPGFRARYYQAEAATKIGARAYGMSGRGRDPVLHGI